MTDDQASPGPVPVTGSMPGQPGSPGGSRPPRAGIVLGAAISAGLIAGLASWAVNEFASNAFRPPLQRSEVMGQVIFKARFEDQAAADVKNAVLSSSLLGAILGSCLGMAGGLARGSFRAAWTSGLAGLLLGGLLSSGCSTALLPLYFRAEEQSKEALSQDLTIPLLLLGGTWAAAGLGGGVALGFGLGRDRVDSLESGLGGLLGGLLGTVAYLVAGAFAFPSSKTAMPLPPDWNVRPIGAVLVTTLAGLTSALFWARRAAGVNQVPT